MQNEQSSSDPNNPSKALSALAKYNVARERARQALQVEITKEEKALQRFRFTFGQAILDDSTLLTSVVVHLPSDLKETAADYVRRKAIVEERRRQMRELD